MSTPLQNAVEAYIRRQTARFHMPGHKGSPIFPVGEAARWDITEVPGADSLYEASGAIAETESRYAALYGTKATLLSTGGSTLCIQTMLALAAKPGSRMICARGCHTAAVNAMALLDIEPVWIHPAIDRATGLAQAVSAEQVAKALQTCPDAACVYLTSPSYFGVLCDIAAIARVCRRHGVPLLVDNAHGAHLRFLGPDWHPMQNGADLCCDSLHKTLPVLTGGALLHIGNEAFVAQAKHRMSLFGSTSPSYLILLSIDSALSFLENDARAHLAKCAEWVGDLHRTAAARGFLLPSGSLDPIRLSLGFAGTGMSATRFLHHLAQHGVEPEYLSERFCVFLAGTHNTSQDRERLEQAIASCEQTGSSPLPAHSLQPIPRQAVKLRDALFAEQEWVETENAENRICAGMIAPCPPGIPIAMPGEILGKSLCDSLKSYGILSVNVLK